MEQCAASAEEIRDLDADVDLDGMFLFEAGRRVMNDQPSGSTAASASPTCCCQTVTVRYDSAAPPTQPLQVLHLGAKTVQWGCPRHSCAR